MAQRGFTLKQLQEMTGQEAGVSDWVVITQDMIDRFADLTFDRQWIHVDPERARAESRFGTTVAHGFLTLSLLSKLSHDAVEVVTDRAMRVNYGLNRVRFVSPVPVGSRVRGRFTPQEVTEDGLTWHVTVELEGSTRPALVAEWIVRFY